VKIQSIPVERLNAAAYNPRKELRPTDREYKKLARSIDKFGYVEPIIWNERTGNVVGGHQRLKILIASGVKKIDVSVVDLSDQDEKALNIALNKIDGEWDNEKLFALIDELSQSLDATITGFDQEEIDAMIASLSEEAGEYSLPGTEPYINSFFESGPQNKLASANEAQTSAPKDVSAGESALQTWVVTALELSDAEAETVIGFLSAKGFRYKAEQAGGKKIA